MKSPCLLRCSRNPAGGCNACYRTKDELTNWSAKTGDERRVIWKRLYTKTPYLIARTRFRIVNTIAAPGVAMFLLCIGAVNLPQALDLLKTIFSSSEE